MTPRIFAALLPLPALALANAPVAAQELVVGRLLNAELMHYESQSRMLLTAVVRVNNGNYVSIRCEQSLRDASPTVDLVEAHALMRAYIAGGSGTNIEVTVSRDTSPTGFPTYRMQTWKMPIPGAEAYQFNCGDANAGGD